MKKTERTWAVTGLGETARAALSQGMPATEVWSLLLDVVEQRASQRTPARLLQQWDSDRFVASAIGSQLAAYLFRRTTGGGGWKGRDRQDK